MSNKPMLDKIKNPDVPGLEEELPAPPTPPRISLESETKKIDSNVQTNFINPVVQPLKPESQEIDKNAPTNVINPVVQPPAPFYMPTAVPIPPAAPQISNEMWWIPNESDSEMYNQWYENAYKTALIADREKGKEKKGKFLKKKDDVVDPIKDAERVADAQKQLSELMKPLKCDLCNAVMNSTLQSKLHYQGKPHQKKVSMFLNQSGKKPSKGDDNQISSTTSNSDWKDYCNLCKIWFTSKTDATQHYAGKRHVKIAYGATHSKPAKKNINTSQQIDPTGRYGIGMDFLQESPIQFVPPMDPPVIPPAEINMPVVIAQYSELPTPLTCDLCGISTNRPDQLEMHKRGAKHLKMLKSIVPSVTMNNTPSSATIDYSIHRTPSGQYYCSTCNISVNSESMFKQHIESKKHNNKMCAKQEAQDGPSSKKMKKK